MHQLTIDQKIENLDEIIRQKEKKVENLQKEISNLKIKMRKLIDQRQKGLEENSTKTPADSKLQRELDQIGRH